MAEILIKNPLRCVIVEDLAGARSVVTGLPEEFGEKDGLFEQWRDLADLVVSDLAVHAGGRGLQAAHQGASRGTAKGHLRMRLAEEHAASC
jgi:hypothetical protein